MSISLFSFFFFFFSIDLPIKEMICTLESTLSKDTSFHVFTPKLSILPEQIGVAFNRTTTIHSLRSTSSSPSTSTSTSIQRRRRVLWIDSNICCSVAQTEASQLNLGLDFRKIKTNFNFDGSFQQQQHYSRRNNINWSIIVATKAELICFILSLEQSNETV